MADFLAVLAVKSALYVFYVQTRPDGVTEMPGQAGHDGTEGGSAEPLLVHFSVISCPKGRGEPEYGHIPVISCPMEGTKKNRPTHGTVCESVLEEHPAGGRGG